MSEMEFIYPNQIWDLVKPPEWIKTIGCKWVYKKRREVDGKVKTLKVRLVAKWFT